MKMNLLETTLYAGLLAVGLTASASPLQRADLPAEPAWVVHFDVDGLRPTTIGQYLQGEMDKPEAQAKLAAFQQIFSVDLRTQLHGLTLYSTGTSSSDGVLLVYADFDAGKLLTLAKATKDYQSSTYKQHTIHNWIDDKKKPHNGVQPRVYAAIEGARVIFGQREATVSQALDVLDGTVPRLSTSSTLPELGAAGDTSFIEAAGRKLDISSSDPNAAIFRFSKLARLQIKEVQGQVNATLTLDANDEAVAGNMLSIGQGLVGLMKLQKEKPEAVKFADALAVKQDGARVVATLAMPAADFVEMLKADAARKAAKKAQKQQAAADVK